MAEAPAAAAGSTGRGGLRAGGAALALGAVAALGFAPFDWPLATVAGLAGIMLLQARSGSVRQAIALGWVFAAAQYGVALHWLYAPFQVDAARDGWMAPFAVAFMAGGLALFWAAAFGAARWIGPGALPLALTVAAAEYLRSVLFTGFPWALVGQIWAETPVIGVIAWTGVHGLTLLTLAGVALCLPGGRAWPGRAVLPLAAAGAAWLWLDPGPPPAAAADWPLVRIVQPNVPQAEKNDPDAIPGQIDRLLTLTAGGPRADLVVWPETALPYLLDYSGEVLSAAAAAAQGAPLAIGAQRREGESRYYNSLVVVDAAGRVTATYDKHHLVPFGEYVPFGELAARWGIRGLAASEGGGYATGPGPAVIDLPGIGPAMPLICYEGIFAEEVAAAPRRPRVLLLVTNDAWFGSFAGPFQHFALGRLRAIEQGLPMIRAANTGVSALIDGRGRVLGSIPLGQAGAITLPLPPALGPTPYARTGDWPAVAAILLGLGAALAGRRHNPR
jgi:apolipoprotein N-acyltransferase